MMRCSHLLLIGVCGLFLAGCDFFEQKELPDEHQFQDAEWRLDDHNFSKQLRAAHAELLFGAYDNRIHSRDNIMGSYRIEGDTLIIKYNEWCNPHTIFAGLILRCNSQSLVIKRLEGSLPARLSDGTTAEIEQEAYYFYNTDNDKELDYPFEKIELVYYAGRVEQGKSYAVTLDKNRKIYYWRDKRGADSGNWQGTCDPLLYERIVRTLAKSHIVSREEQLAMDGSFFNLLIKAGTEKTFQECNHLQDNELMLHSYLSHLMSISQLERINKEQKMELHKRLSDKLLPATKE